MKHEINLFVTMMLESYQDQIIADLVKSGYVVKAISDTGKPCSSEQGDKVSTVMTLNVMIHSEKPAKDVLSEFSAVAQKIISKVKYYSFNAVLGDVTSGYIWVCWSQGNITLSKNKPTPKKPRTEIPHLKLVPSE